MRFTICVPTLNAQSTWREFATVLKNQSAKPEQVIVIDSSSDDQTPSLAFNDGFKVITIARNDFRHGATRQLAVKMCPSSEILIYLTQDSMLASTESLSLLLRPFDDKSIGAAYGRQLPRIAASPIEAHARMFNYPPESQVKSVDCISTCGFKTIFFSNSFGAYRKRALEQVGGFPMNVNFGEDTVVAARLILAGWKIAYAADAQTYHSHEYSIFEEYQRYVEIGRLHSIEHWLTKRFGGASGEGFKFIKSQLRMLAREAPQMIPSAILRAGFKYLGYATGRKRGIREVRSQGTGS